MEERFQIFHDLVTQSVMADSCHPDVVLLREVLYANCNVSHSVGLVCGLTSRKANAAHLLCWDGAPICIPGKSNNMARSVTLRYLKSSVPPLNRKDKAVGQTSVL